MGGTSEKKTPCMIIIRSSSNHRMIIIWSSSEMIIIRRKVNISFLGSQRRTSSSDPTRLSDCLISSDRTHFETLVHSFYSAHQISQEVISLIRSDKPKQQSDEWHFQIILWGVQHFCSPIWLQLMWKDQEDEDNHLRSRLYITSTFVNLVLASNNASQKCTQVLEPCVCYGCMFHCTVTVYGEYNIDS